MNNKMKGIPISVATIVILLHFCIAWPLGAIYPQ